MHMWPGASASLDLDLQLLIRNCLQPCGANQVRCFSYFEDTGLKVTANSFCAPSNVIVLEELPLDDLVLHSGTTHGCVLHVNVNST